jgi:hypothetical protein
VGNVFHWYFDPYFISVGALVPFFHVWRMYYLCQTFSQATILGALVYAFFLFHKYWRNVNIMAHLGGPGLDYFSIFAATARKIDYREQRIHTACYAILAGLR